MQRLKVLGFSALLATAQISIAEGCIELGVKEQDKEYQGYGIKSTGSYCITADVSVNERSHLNHGWELIYESSGAMGVNASNVEVDLQQHTMTSKASRAKQPTGAGIFSNQKNILIHNGALRVTGKRGIGVIRNPSGYPYIKIFDKNAKSTTCDMYSASCEDISYLEGPDKLPPKYQDANITLDNMNIFATYRGVVLADNHNVIRNSTIEVDGHTAIYLMGQYPIIENNTIIIHGRGAGEFYQEAGRSETTEEDGKRVSKIIEGKKTNILSAPIKLRDAQGGIIRNNRIIYKGGLFSGKAPVAINLLDSKDVLIEDNIIEGFDNLVRENGDTSHNEKNNTIKW